MNAPEWLLEDIKRLALEEVRLSCAIYELYKYYANTFHGHIGVDEHLERLTLENERLDWIDENTDVIKYAITNY